MKKILFFSLLFCCSFALRAQGSEIANKDTIVSQDNNVNYRLYPTNNKFNFLKLDTRTGEIRQVQWTIDGDEFECILNDIPLAVGIHAKTGRFNLYPTSNTWTFLLVDQIDGRVWHVQWSFEKQNRFIQRIY